MDSVPQKRCSRCKEYFPATTEWFPKNSRTKDGLFAYCKPCNSAKCKEYDNVNKAKNKQRGKAYREINRDKLNAAKRDWYIENREHCLQYAKDYAKNNHEEVALREKRYHENNRVRIRERDRRKYANNPSRQIANYHKRRARKAVFPDTLTAQEWVNAVDYFYGCCAVCGRQAKDLLNTHRLAMDHWIPLSNPNCPGTIALNIVPLCHGQQGCNNRKKNRDPIEFLETEFGKRKAKKIAMKINEYFASLEAAK